MRIRQLLAVAGAFGVLASMSAACVPTTPPATTTTTTTTTTSTTTTTVPTPDVVQLATSGFAECALASDGSVACWGNNQDGELGLGDVLRRGDAPGEMGANLPRVQLGTGVRATAIAAGSGHACAIVDGGQVKCWGNNLYGRLGLGNSSNRGDQAGEMGDQLPTVPLGTGRSAVALAVGGSTCAILDNGQLKCWGNNGSGQLGLGDTNHRGDQPAEMGDQLPAISLGAGRRAVQVSVGTDHTCALLDDGTVKCWGFGAYGRLGSGATLPVGDQAGEMGDALQPVDLGAGRTATKVSAGTWGTCALLDDGQVKCWGYNYYGQLGLGDTAQRGDQPGEMGDALPVVPLGTGRTAQDVQVGQQQVCVLLDNHSVKCWGYNHLGELGLGDTVNRGDQPGELGDALPAVALGTGWTTAQVDVGTAYGCALATDARVKCWGDNSRGQLGLGDTAHRGDGPGEMGDALGTVDLAP